MDLTAPIVVGFYKQDPFEPELADTAIVAALHKWCSQEGFMLGVPYREQSGNGALDTMIATLQNREDVVGVVVPSMDHLGPTVEAAVSRISKTGKQLFVAYPTQARR